MYSAALALSKLDSYYTSMHKASAGSRDRRPFPRFGHPSILPSSPFLRKARRHQLLIAMAAASDGTYGSLMARTTLFVALLAALLPAPVRGHGQMFEPKPRQPEPLYWYQVGCMIGCNCSHPAQPVSLQMAV